MTDPVPFSERDDDDSIDDLLAMINDAIVTTDNPEEMIQEVIGDVLQNHEAAGVLGNFVFIGEVVGNDGEVCLMVATSENLPDWIARGMLMTAEEFIMGGMLE